MCFCPIIGEIKESCIKQPWRDKEISALVQYIALYHDGDSVWPSSKKKCFWEMCGKGISESTGVERSGKVCFTTICSKSS